jgi:F0F1-type ATP synthase assembly protein I
VKRLLALMLLCVAFAVLKAVLIALLVALLLVLAYASITRPGETLVFMVALTIFTVASAQPVAFIITLGVVGVAVVVAGARAKARGRLLLTDRRDES